MKRLESLGLQLGTVAVVALALLITANVVGRALFGQGVPDTVIMVRELMIPAIMLPLGAATAQRAHIAVTVLADRLPPRVQGGLIVFGTLVALLALLPLLYAGGREALRAFSSGAFYDGDFALPRWPMRAVFWWGLAAMWLRLAWQLIADITTLRRHGAIPDTHPDEAV
ncbi:TRAP transporter small permease [Paracoccus jiaweipingae]|uniref:TRAP transporter small permease n=1 Tax=unclassified Paracoccus (in: a-proteobacteria) TaxID=2688777 RepID=UPI0037B6C30F